MFHSGKRREGTGGDFAATTAKSGAESSFGGFRGRKSCQDQFFVKYVPRYSNADERYYGYDIHRAEPY